VFRDDDVAVVARRRIVAARVHATVGECIDLMAVRLACQDDCVSLHKTLRVTVARRRTARS
jgi:hypothetical protein